MSAYEKVIDLAYGENPHQRAAYYAQAGARMHVLSMVRQVARPASCRSTTCSTSTPGACSSASSRSRRARSSSTTTRAASPSASTALEAYERAFACDPRRPSAASCASTARSTARSPRRCAQQFCEVLFAPRLHRRRRSTVLAAKPNMRVLEDNERRRFDIAERDLKRVMGGLLVQDRDLDLEDRSEMEVVTERKPSEARVGRDAVRLEGLQARALQRDRARPRAWRRSASAPGR